jgi:hypothetical protein
MFYGANDILNRARDEDKVTILANIGAGVDKAKLGFRRQMGSI